MKAFVRGWQKAKERASTRSDGGAERWTTTGSFTTRQQEGDDLSPTPKLERSVSSEGAARRPPPAAGPVEVELQVQAVGLNFRDVLLVLGEYPGPFTPPGGDCSGVVSAAGGSVAARFSRGDDVFGLAPGCLCSFVRARTDARLMVDS